jgi:hypothetical protein
MPEAFEPSQRPSLIPVWGRAAIAVLLGTSFISGALIWWGQTIQANEMTTPPWLRACLVLHGALNPFLCVLFGILLCHHIRVGWRMRANLISGFIMELTFATLILTGIGLYYVGSEWRDAVVWIHRICGLLVPVSLGIHWVSGLSWARKAAASPVR